MSDEQSKQNIMLKNLEYKIDKQNAEMKERIDKVTTVIDEIYKFIKKKD